MSDTPKRERLADERPGLTLKARIPRLKADYETVNGPTEDIDDEKDNLYLKMYVTANTDETGALKEIFVRADKVGSFTSGLLDQLAIAISVGLQYGIPMETYTSKMRATKFEPAGLTGNKDVPICTSPLDLIARWLDLKFKKRGADKKELSERSMAVTDSERPASESSLPVAPLVSRKKKNGPQG